MENNKDIGKLFREKIDQLDQSPNENGWFAIQSELDKKEKRRMLPFWLWYAGIFSVGISIAILVYSTNNYPSASDGQKDKKFNIHNNKTDLNNGKVSQKGEYQIFESEIKNINNEKVIQKNDTQTTESEITNLNNDSKLTVNDSDKNETIIEVTSIKKSSLNKNSKTSKINSKTYKSIASKPEKIAKTKRNKSLKTNVMKRNKTLKNIISIASNKVNNLETAVNHDDSSNKSVKNSVDTFIFSKDEQLVDNGKEKETKTQKLVGNLKVKSKIADAIEKDSITKNDENEKIITVFVYGSPTAMGTIGTKSLIDNRLEKAASFSEFTYGYGAYLCYQGTARLSFRLGVAKNNLKFLTKNVNINTFNYDNIQYENGISNQSIFNQSNDSQSMTISQDLSYIEIPFEIKYKILDTKIGLNAIIGVKQLFLDKNEVYAITSNGFKSKIGQTNNLLKQTFGANLGLGLDYKISKRIKINLETMFQFNIKTTQNTEDSKPFSIGVLTGLEFSVFGK